MARADGRDCAGSVLALALCWALGPTTSLAEDEPWFEERTQALGVDFVHHHFGQGSKEMPENMGPGMAVLDVDGDDRLDLYFPQGAPLLGGDHPAPANSLLIQDDDRRFAVAEPSEGAGDTGYGMGAAHGDVDGDGDRDLYVTNFGPNALYRSRGDGTFERYQAGVEHPGWGTGAAFFDADGDGDLDLYVANYVAFEVGKGKWCGNARLQIRSYCHPDVYPGQRDVFYRNRGDGTFDDATDVVGLRPAAEAKGLGVLAGDLDGDGLADVYVANDSTGNHLYLGSRGASGHGFREEALLAGLGFNGSGAAEASMGIAYGDLDGSGRGEIFLTHLDEETNTLYRSTTAGLWNDVTARAGLDHPSRPWVGFGTVAFDADHDGDLDLVVVNGHILDNIERFDASRRHRQPAQLFENRGDGTFVERPEALGLAEDLVGRGLVAADLDDDGALDLVLTQNGGPAKVLINRVGSEHPAVRLRLRGTRSPRDGSGARVTLQVGGRSLVRERIGGGSYLSQGPAEVHFGLAGASVADAVEVRWPSGQVDRHPRLEAGRVYTLEEGSEMAESRPLRKPWQAPVAAEAQDEDEDENG